MPTSVITYPVPAGAPASDHVEVHAGGQETGVFATGPHSYAAFSFEGGPVDVSIRCKSYVRDVRVRPRSAGIRPDVFGHLITFTLDRPRKLSIEIDGDSNLFLFADTPETPPPAEGDPGVLFYGPGYYDLEGETLALTSGQTLYVAGGAYLDNVKALLVDQAHDVLVRGRGVLVAPTRVYRSHDVSFEGIIQNPNVRTWMNKIDASQYITYRNVKVLAGDDTVVNYDGFDVMSDCHHVHVQDAFVRANDDILSVKHHPHSPGYWSSKAGISHVSVTDTVAWNLKGGSICRIGPESIGPYIENIRMAGIDVIHNQAGAVFEIRTVDGTRIENIQFEDFRIEEDHQPLLRFDMKEWYRIGDGRGTVHGVYFRNIDVRRGPGDGTLEGENEEHTFSGLYFDDVRIDRTPAATLRDLGVKGEFVTDAHFDKGGHPPEDTQPPGVGSVGAFATRPDGSATSLYVTFTEPVPRASAEDLAHYALSGSAHVVAARVAPGFRHVLLTVDLLPAGADHQLTVTGLRDLSGNGMAAPSVHTFTVAPRWRASEGFAAWQGFTGWHYEQFNPADVQVYASREDIVQAPTYWLMNARHESGGLVWRAHRRDAWIGPDRQQAGAEYHAVRTWMAPAGGTIEVEGNPDFSGAERGRSTCSVVHGPGGSPSPDADVVLASSSGGPISADCTCKVVPGDVIRFIVAGPAGKAGEPVLWDPVIRYIA